MGRLYGKSAMSLMSTRQPPIPKDTSRQGRGRVRDVEIFMRKPARKGRPTGGLSSPFATVRGGATGARLTVAVSRNFVGSVPDGNR
jgi:hypothetical protein